MASIAFGVVFGGWILFEIVFTACRRPRREDRRHDRGSSALVFGAIFVSFLIMDNAATSAPAAAIAADPRAVFAAGIMLALAGIALRLWAIHVLGHSFTAAITARPDQSVVDYGPYRLIRHPSYAGAIVTVFGAALCFANWLSLVAAVPVFVAYAYRIRVEEAMLEGRLGRAYTDYRQRTKRLIPFLF
jgi:protein-S-isoprenylcysteine O-methyltransferase Ste14